MPVLLPLSPSGGTTDVLRAGATDVTDASPPVPSLLPAVLPVVELVARLSSPAVDDGASRIAGGGGG